jgi:hypothetical protein
MKPKPQLRKPNKSAENGATVVIVIFTAIIVVAIGFVVLDFLEIIKF